MILRLKRKSTTLVFLLLAGCGMVSRCKIPAPLDKTGFDALYAAPAPVPQGPLRVYHLGHSLVGQDMPAMLAQLATASVGEGHTYESQLGWGTTLKAHWDPDTPINGFEKSNNHPRYRDAHGAVTSGAYDALVLTESVEIRDAIKYSDSARYLHEWRAAARAKNPSIRVYFYESWPELDDPEGWLLRLDRDMALYWEDEILRRALNYDALPQPIYMIPAGQVMAAFVRAIEARGGIGPIKTRADLFRDTIHFNDLGAYLVALTHYAVIYQKSPIGLPHALKRADGSMAAAPGRDAARLMQEITWQVVIQYNRSGVRKNANP
ncbi:MAG: hypothetical protein V3V25_13135 [Paracoccaceae bacterium]